MHWRRPRQLRFSLLVFLLIPLHNPTVAEAQSVDPNDTNLVALRQALFSGLANQIGTLPTPTGGGFTYVFDPTMDLFRRKTDGFGPIFAERAETTGRGTFTLTASFTRHTFDDVDGINLRNGEIKVLVAGPGPRLNL